MPRCEYFNCRNHSSNLKEHLSFHRIPKQKAIREVWFARIGREAEASRNLSAGFVCSKHFRNHEFLHLSNKTYLKKNSLPIQYEMTEHMEIDSALDTASKENNISFHGQCLIQQEVVLEDHDLTNFMGVVEEVQSENDATACKVRVEEVPYICKEHNYAKSARFTNRTGLLTGTSYKQRVKISEQRRIIHQLRRKVKAAEKSADKKYAKFKNFDKVSDFAQEFITIVLKHYKKKSHPRKYSVEMRQFALTLHYYSPTAYEYVRDVFLSCLPCCQTIRNWYCSIGGDPGFSNEALLALQNLQFETPYPIVGCLLVDGMSLRKHVQHDGKINFGYVDFGGVIPSDKRSLAKEALNMMFVGMNKAIKISFGYFLINGIGAQQLAHMVSTGVEILRDCGLIVGTLAFDGLTSNFAMSKILGCEYVDVSKLKTTMDIGECLMKLFAWPDMPHMIKLFRNALHDLAVFLNAKNEKIEWKYVVRLFEFQKTIGLHLGNKLRKLHVHYKNQIMKVYLATQLFSSSVADAIEICDKTFHLPDFRGSGPTVECIRIMNDLFDIFNSFDMTQSSFKQPLNSENFDVIMSRMDVARHFLLNLKDINGTFIYNSNRNTCIIGMLMLIESLKGFYEEYVVNRQLLGYVPTYKAGQDNIEIFHCQMRAHSGFNSNPTPIQYKSAFRKALVHVQVRTKKTANCISLENIPILSVNSTRAPTLNNIEEFITDLDNSELELDGFLSAVLTEHYINENYLYEYINIVAYISGFVARRLTNILKCKTCVNALITTDPNDPEFMIILGKQKGGLFLPSRSVREICSLADKTFCHFLKTSGGKMMNVEFTVKKMTMVVAKQFSEDRNLFDELERHFRSSPNDFHYYILIREIASLYLKIRVHYLNKSVSGNDGTRQKKIHEVHFLGM